MVPGNDYSDLVIGEGETASAAFVDIVEGRVDEDELDDVLFDLLEYCKRDTELGEGCLTGYGDSVGQSDVR